MLTGDNGILTKAGEAKERTERASIIEQIQTDILDYQVENKSKDIDKAKLKSVLDKYFKDVPTELPTGEELSELSLETLDKYGTYMIKVSEIYNGKIKTESIQIIDRQENYCGYYADINEDGIVDGVIYADLAKGNTESSMENYGGYSYNIPIITDFNEYYISQMDYEGIFGKKDVISPLKNGNNRFYVMALEDVPNSNGYNAFSWYGALESSTYGMTDYETTTSIDFGKGFSNSKNMINRYKNNSYGPKDANGPQYPDIWGIIENEVNTSFFVPSLGEWVAFSTLFSISKDNYTDFGLSHNYWTSSQQGIFKCYRICFKDGIVDTPNGNNYYNIRLSTFF